MNPTRYADEKDFASGLANIHGMGMNVFSRLFEIQRKLRQIQLAVEQLQSFQNEYNEGNLSSDTASSALVGVKRLMRGLDTIEYAFPDLEELMWFVGFQDDVHHVYWRVEDGKFNGVLDMEESAIDSFSREVERILSNISDSINTNPINQLHRYLERYGDDFHPHNSPEEYYNEVFEARDLFCLGYYSTGLIVLGRAVERALMQLGEARKINSVDGFRGSTDWDSARFFERTEALYYNDMPDDSGKIISKRQYHLIHLLIDYRNQVAHKEYRTISQDSATRMMGQALTLLRELEEQREHLEEMEDNLIRELTDVSINL